MATRNKIAYIDGVHVNVPVYSDNESNGEVLMYNSTTARYENQDVTSSASLPTLAGGTYTPATSNLSNISSITLANGYYTRIGNAVTVHFSFTVTPSATGSSTFRCSIPVARPNFTLVNQGAGNCIFRNVNMAQSKEGIVTNVVGTQQMLIEFEVITSVATQRLCGSFGYQLN